MRRTTTGNITIETNFDEALEAVGNAEQEALISVGPVLKNLVKDRAPQGPTGNLKSSIDYGVSDKYHSLSIYSLDKIAPHNHLIEYGTVKMEAQPFMRRTIDEQKGMVLNSLSSVMGRKS